MGRLGGMLAPFMTDLEKEFSDHTVGLQHPERVHPPSGSASAIGMQISVQTLTGKTITWKWSPQTLLKMWRPRFRIKKAFPQTSSVLSLLASSWRMAALCLTTTSRRSPLSTWCCVSVVAAHFRLFQFHVDTFSFPTLTISVLYFNQNCSKCFLPHNV